MKMDCDPVSEIASFFASILVAVKVQDSTLPMLPQDSPIPARSQNDDATANISSRNRRPATDVSTSRPRHLSPITVSAVECFQRKEKNLASSPQPAVPPRKPVDKHIVWAVLLVIAFIIVSGILMIWFGLRIVSHSVQVTVNEAGPESRVATVQTPIGNFKISKAPASSDLDLGLPIYPGATRAEDSTDDNSISLNFDLPNETNLRIAAAKFNTPDRLTKVQEFYRQQLGREISSFTHADQDGKVVFEMKHGDQDKVVSLASRGGGTEIHLVRIFHGHSEPN